MSLTVNGRSIRAEVAPRTHLADFLREDLLLTGTHLGCEHGICGACTLLIDDAPARSCIAFAAACEGADVQTIEGLEHDPIMTLLRAAFTAEHALQCGYCTPGMLVTARDIVLRLPDADADRIRLELAGNLCRCTGYAGIVHAIQRVLRERPRPNAHLKARDDSTGPSTAPPPPAAGEGWGEGPKPPPKGLPTAANRDTGPSTTPAPPSMGLGREADQGRGEAAAPSPQGPTDQSITQALQLSLPLDTIWTALQDPALIAQCVPGARLTSATPDHLTGELTTSLGPIRAHFTGTARVTYGPDHTGTVSGEGQDRATKTHLRASAAFALTASTSDACTLTLTTTYALRGPLAQFGRGPIVHAFATELAETVARTLEARLRGTAPPLPPHLRLFPLLVRALRTWLRRHWHQRRQRRQRTRT